MTLPDHQFYNDVIIIIDNQTGVSNMIWEILNFLIFYRS